MTSSLNLFEQALQAPTMEAVIALSERVQTLEARPEGVVYTAYRAIDQTLLIGYTEALSATTTKHQQRGFELVEARRGTAKWRRPIALTALKCSSVSMLREQDGSPCCSKPRETRRSLSTLLPGVLSMELKWTSPL